MSTDQAPARAPEGHGSRDSLGAARSGRGGAVVSLLALTLAVGGVLVATRLVPLPATKGPVKQRLSLAADSPELACPGSETLAVPAGGNPFAAPGPVFVTGLASDSRSTSTSTSTSRLAVAGLRAYGKGSQLAINAAGETKTADRVRITASDTDAATQSIALNKLGPVVLAAQTPHGADKTPRLAGMQSLLTRGGDQRGLTAVSCATPSASIWLVGGGTKSGERLRLVLSNPLKTPAVTDIEIHGPNGPVSAPSGDQVVVPAMGTTVRFIDSMTEGLPSVAVHVTARSGRVVATMNDNVLRGLNPGGVDDISASAGPSTEQVIPGVSLVNGYSKTAADPAAAGSTSIRIAVPGTDAAVVRVHLLDSTGTVDLPAGAVVNVPAGGVVNVPVSGVPSKTYTAVVESDVPVVASARVGRSDPAAQPGAAEFGWASSASRIEGAGYVVLPKGAESTLSLAAPDGAARVRVQDVTAAGQVTTPQDLAISAGTSIAVQAGAKAVALRIEPLSGGMLAATLVAMADDDRGTLISTPAVRISQTVKPRPAAVSDPQLGLPKD